jgi:putative peptidoglycan lipid II flippase
MNKRLVLVDSKAAPGPAAGARGSGFGAMLASAGILASKLFGLVRERAFAHYFGNSLEAGVYRAALRIPNFLQNLFGEGVLSLSFIPPFVDLRKRGDDEGALRLAGAVFGLLALVTSLLVALGVWLTPLFIDAVAPGFSGDSRDLAIQLVRILFPGTGLLVMSAWCLGILNSHKRFFLPYAAPVLWNLAIIASMVVWGGSASQRELVEVVTWGTVVGSALQFLVQLPQAVGLLGGLRPSLDVAIPGVRDVLGNFVPTVAGRGVVQLSAYVDTAIASLISPRALSGLSYAQTLYLIPVALFGTAVSAAELPEMASVTGTEAEVAEKLRSKLEAGARRMAFFVVPSSAAFLVLGDVISGALFQTGRFGAADTRYLWYLLAGSTVGLLASTRGRLLQSALYVLKDPRRPLWFGMVRVGLGALLAWLAATRLTSALGLPSDLGAVGITAAAGIAAWVEYLLLKRAVDARVGATSVEASYLAKLWGAALLAALAGLGAKIALVQVAGPSAGTSMEWGGTVLPMPGLPPAVVAAVVLPVVAAVYGGLTIAMRVEQAMAFADKLVRSVRRR